MSEQIIIDSLEFAKKSRAIHGTIALFDLPRVQSALQNAEGKLEYWLDGKANVFGDPGLELKVRGLLVLACQRCLGPMDFLLDTTTRFVLVAGEGDLPEPEDEDPDVEYLVADPRLHVAALIEDEVLLNLPYSPAHEDLQCGRTEGATTEQKESPFKVLKGLKITKS